MSLDIFNVDFTAQQTEILSESVYTNELELVKFSYERQWNYSSGYHEKWYDKSRWTSPSVFAGQELGAEAAIQVIHGYYDTEAVLLIDADGRFKARLQKAR